MAESHYTSFDSISFREIEAEADLIPLMTSEDEEALNKEALPKSIPILPLKNTVLFFTLGISKIQSNMPNRNGYK